MWATDPKLDDWSGWGDRCVAGGEKAVGRQQRA